MWIKNVHLIVNFGVTKSCKVQRNWFLWSLVLDYGGSVDTVSVLKDISPPPATEPIVLPLESIVEALKTQASVYKERLVTGTYIGRNNKQVRLLQAYPFIRSRIQFVSQSIYAKMFVNEKSSTAKLSNKFKSVSEEFSEGRSDTLFTSSCYILMKLSTPQHVTLETSVTEIMCHLFTAFRSFINFTPPRLSRKWEKFFTRVF